jgi:UDP-glucose 4-epimerase
MKVLVAGATGNIGSHVCELLKQHGHYVIGWDTNIWGDYNNIEAYCDEFYKYDVTKSVSSVVTELSDFITLEKDIHDMCFDQYEFERKFNGT